MPFVRREFGRVLRLPAGFLHIEAAQPVSDASSWKLLLDPTLTELGRLDSNQRLPD